MNEEYTNLYLSPPFFVLHYDDESLPFNYTIMLLKMKTTIAIFFSQFFLFIVVVACFTWLCFFFRESNRGLFVNRQTVAEWNVDNDIHLMKERENCFLMKSKVFLRVKLRLGRGDHDNFALYHATS
jgi:hypothetical protein